LMIVQSEINTFDFRLFLCAGPQEEMFRLCRMRAARRVGGVTPTRFKFM